MTTAPPQPAAAPTDQTTTIVCWHCKTPFQTPLPLPPIQIQCPACFFFGWRKAKEASHASET